MRTISEDAYQQVEAAVLLLGLALRNANTEMRTLIDDDMEARQIVFTISFRLPDRIAVR